MATKLQRRYEALKSGNRRRREKAAEATSRMVGAATAGGTAYFIAMQDERAQLDQAAKGDPVKGWELGGMPAPALIGGGLVLLGMTGMAGRQSNLVFSAGEGALMAWASQKGREAAVAVRARRGS